MTENRRPWRAVASVLIAAATLVYIGCSTGRRDGAPDRADRRTDAAPGPDQAGEPGDPGRDPDAVLVLTGQQIGYLEPCGCTEGQSGGLGRRADLMGRLRRDGPALIPLDLGSIIADPSDARGGPDQIRIKLGVGLEALARLGYEALALGADDLEIGLNDFIGQYYGVPDAPPLIATNIEPAEGFEEIFRPSVRVEAGPLSVGVLAVVDPDALTSLADPEQEIFIAAVRDPAEAVREALPELEADTDLQVLMVQGPSGLARSLAESIPGFEVVVGASEYDYMPLRPELFHDGRTTLVLIGKKGQQVGLVDLFADANDRPRYRRIVLDTRFEDVEPIRSLLGEEYLTRLSQNEVLETFPRRPHPSGARFVGAETCKACHPNTFEKWSTTKHALAWPAIESGRRGDRTMDAECVSCHSTGFGFETGFVTAERTPHLRNQQCENCHGPGSLHVTDPVNPEYLDAIRLIKDRDAPSLCIRCHDSDNDPHWNLAVRWPMVAHPDLDDYTDPRTRQGLDLDSLSPQAVPTDSD